MIIGQMSSHLEMSKMISRKTKIVFWISRYEWYEDDVSDLKQRADEVGSK